MTVSTDKAIHFMPMSLKPHCSSSLIYYTIYMLYYIPVYYRMRAVVVINTTVHAGISTVIM